MAFRHYGQPAPAVLISWSSAGILFLTALLATVSLARRLRHPGQIAVDTQRIWYRTWDRGRGDWDTRDIPIIDLRRLALEDMPARLYRGERLVAASDRTTLEFGHDLTPRSRRVLRDLLLASIQEQATGRAGRHYHNRDGWQHRQHTAIAIVRAETPYSGGCGQYHAPNIESRRLNRCPFRWLCAGDDRDIVFRSFPGLTRESRSSLLLISLPDPLPPQRYP
jgi:hypothetical protein